MVELNLNKRDAHWLSESAARLGTARDAGDAVALAAALDRNLEPWIAIRSVVARPECAFPRPICDNLVRLANFVADVTLTHGVGIADDTLDTLIGINRQIAEGLVEGSGSPS